jgi:hypothetical protein
MSVSTNAQYGKGSNLNVLNKEYFMQQYIDKKLAAEFRKSLPKIKRQIGEKPISNLNALSGGVAGNTFRAYGGYQNKPGDIYKSWANKVTAGLLKQCPLRDISTRDLFLIWHNELYKSLQRHWKKHQGEPLPLSHCYKLVDLYIKWISRHQLKEKEFLEALVQNANCALDSQILERLNICYSKALPIRKPSMGHIHNQNTYNLCQSLITAFSESCGGSRLLFDYWAWQKGKGN